VGSGYSGGTTHNPTYQQVCAGLSGHAEAVQTTFDPTVVSYRDFLRVLFAIHDPTTLNRQGADVGTQYRSAIFYHDDEQKAIAQHVVEEIVAARIWDDTIVTEVVPFRAFNRPEDYHQGYFERNGSQPYCRAVIAPKMAKFRRLYLDRLRDWPTTPETSGRPVQLPELIAAGGAQAVEDPTLGQVGHQRPQRSLCGLVLAHWHAVVAQQALYPDSSVVEAGRSCMGKLCFDPVHAPDLHIQVATAV
jgi:peptide-methionine (S)-S-oxide reductase